MIKVAVDAMGGDYAPAEIVKGSVKAAGANEDLTVFLVGNDSLLRKELKKFKNPPRVNIVHAEDVIGMNESPAQAENRKKRTITSLNTQTSSSVSPSQPEVLLFL